VERIELWAEGANRVHDRAAWTRELHPAGDVAFTSGAWRSTRLNP
jgi:pyridoxine/pyridoxamine 5'-phosphate oxidase